MVFQGSTKYNCYLLTNVFYYKNWTNSEWPYVARFYERNGNIDINQTLTYLNKNLKVKLDSLPNLN